MKVPQISNFRHKGMLCLVTTCSLLFFNCKNEKKIQSQLIKIKLDQEIQKNAKAINSSTQSINRYASNLRKLQTASLEFNPNENKLNLLIANEGEEFFKIKNIETSFLTPLLPYEDITSSQFDIANIILAEYARNGISIPIQLTNNEFAYVETSQNLFNDKGEYIFEKGIYQPNKGVLPKRFNVVNNCLSPGLWEVSANDAVGEMYHAWMTLDSEFYKKILAYQTGVQVESIPNNFHDPKYFDNVILDATKLRSIIKVIGDYDIHYNSEKELGSYSSQDSRRKVQRKFYDIRRNDSIIDAKMQSDLQNGDVYSMYTFQEPGVYNPNVRNNVSFQRLWERAKVAYVEPLTFYSKDQEFFSSNYIEITLTNASNTQAIVIGNIPLSLLSFKNDFVIPSFGVGVLKSSELIERRLLRKQKGPRPSFAYLTKVKEGKHYIQNNHLTGLEQIFLRPVQKEDGIYLRCTIVSYERITDLLEFEIKIPELQETFVKNNERYSPPIFETYQDDNTL